MHCPAGRCLAALALLTLAGACGGDDSTGEPLDQLSDWGLFEGPGADAAPSDGVVLYDVISPLFMDHAFKDRYIALPPGERMEYRAEGPWGMPPGTVIVKSFGYPLDARDPSLGRRLLETRLLVLGEDGWTPWVYVWNEEQTRASRTVAGARVPVTWIDEEGVEQTLRYRVPNTNQCEGCHGGDEPMELLGPRTAQMDRDHDYGAGPTNQIDHFAALDMFAEPPAPPAERDRFEHPFDDGGDLDARARAYLDSNCAHCHQIGRAHV